MIVMPIYSSGFHLSFMSVHSYKQGGEISLGEHASASGRPKDIRSCPRCSCVIIIWPPGVAFLIPSITVNYNQSEGRGVGTIYNICDRL